MQDSVLDKHAEEIAKLCRLFGFEITAAEAKVGVQLIENRVREIETASKLSGDLIHRLLRGGIASNIRHSIGTELPVTYDFFIALAIAEFLGAIRRDRGEPKSRKVILNCGEDKVTMGQMRLSLFDFCPTEISGNDLIVTVYEFQIQVFAEGVQHFLHCSEKPETWIDFHPDIEDKETGFRYSKEAMESGTDVVAAISEILGVYFRMTDEDRERLKADRQRPSAALWLRGHCDSEQRAEVDNAQNLH